MIGGMIGLFVAAAISIGAVSIRLHNKNQQNFQERMQSILQNHESMSKQEMVHPEEPQITPTSKKTSFTPKTEEGVYQRYIPPEKQNLDAAAVPSDCVFSEAMGLMLYLAKTYHDTFRFLLYVPLSASEVAAFEQRSGIELTEELRALYQFTNGFEWNCGYIRIMELDQVEKHLSDRYEWGDSKHYVWLGSRVGDGEEIYFDLDSRQLVTHFEGEETKYNSLTKILEMIIDSFVECEVEDERLDAYLQYLRISS